MKNRCIAILTILLFSYGTCKKEPLPSDCIQKKIAEIKAQPKWNPPAKVDEYLYQGKRIFVFSANCCDQYTQAFDQDCNYICAPSGGITGKGDGKCTDFLKEAQFVRNIWKDER